MFKIFVRRLATEKSINRVTLIGRVGQDAKLKGSTESPVVQFSLATNTPLGDDYSRTEWHKVSIFKPSLRTLAEKYVKSGTRLFVDGKLSYGTYKNASNQEVQSTSIIADDIIFLQRNEDER